MQFTDKPFPLIGEQERRITPMGEMLIEMEGDNLQELVQIRQLYEATLRELDKRINDLQTKEAREAFLLLQERGYAVKGVIVDDVEAYLEEGQVLTARMIPKDDIEF